MIALRSLSVSRRLALLAAICLMGIISLVAMLLISERTLIMQERQLGVQQGVESAHSLVAHFHAQALAGPARPLRLAGAGSGRSKLTLQPDIRG